MRRFLLLAALTATLATPAVAAPLSLSEVLVQADQPHPDLGYAEAQVEWAKAEQQLADSQDDFRLTLEAGLRSGRNSLTNDHFEADHYARLNARKLLWDGGLGSLASAAAQLESGGREALLEDARQQRRLALMTRFFDVLIGDIRYAAETEFAAVAYVAWDNARERHELGELSSPALADFETRFQESRLKRNLALRQAREKRALLAAAMNRPDDLPAELLDPELRPRERKPAEFAALLAAMEAGNPRLKALRQRLAAAQNRLAAQRSANRPSLEFEAETAAYSRDSYTRDEVRAGLNLIWPLWQGQRTDALVAREQAQFRMLQAEHEQLRLALRQSLFEAREEIVHLIDSEWPAARSNSTLRDLNLERAQAEYELELKTNLGTNMAETQIARLRRKAVDYRLALAWERLAALIGQPVEAIPLENSKS